jgi:serine/threonine protein kinase
VDPPSRTQPPLGQNQSAAAFQDSGLDIVSLTPGSRVGPYEIVGLVGAGAMGQVYRARDSRLRRDVAIKILPPHFAAGAEHLGAVQA